MIVLLEIVGKNVRSLQSVSQEEELMTEIRTFGGAFQHSVGHGAKRNWSVG